MKRLLQQLTESFGPSGYEDNVRALVRAEVESLADEVRVDALGSLIARKKPSKPGGGTRKIMIAAHMDEIGLIVSHVDEKGFVRFSPIGTVFRRYVPGGRVRFLNGTQGVIGFDRLMHPERDDGPHPWLAHDKWAEHEVLKKLGVKELG